MSFILRTTNAGKARIRAACSFHSSSSSSYRVCVVGAHGGIGQPLSLLLKQNPLVTHLALYDVNTGTPGMAVDLSHMDTPAKVTGYTGDDLHLALKDADVVVCPAGIPRKPGMTRDDLFATNAGIVASTVSEVAKACPNASLLIISNPVNSTVPICAEILKKAGKYNKNKLFGVTTLDVVRANRFISDHQKWDVTKTNVTVVGGHAGITIIPLLSQLPQIRLSQQDKEALTQRIMFGGDEVVKAKGGSGSATLSMAYAGARFTHSILRAMKGEKGVIECSYVESNVVDGVRFFSSRIELGVNGIDKIHPLGNIDEFEKKKLSEAIPELKSSIDKGIQFAKDRPE